MADLEKTADQLMAIGGRSALKQRIAILTALQQARDDALEEAALTIESCASDVGYDGEWLARQVRSLKHTKGNPAQPKGRE